MHPRFLFLAIVVMSMNGITVGMDSSDGERDGDGRRADYARGSVKRSLTVRLAETSGPDSSDGEELMPKRRRRITIFDAIDDGDSQKVDFLINQGIDIEQTNGFDQTPLIVAAQAGYSNMVEALLENRASLSAKDMNDYTALMYAAENNDVDVIRVLAEHCNYQRRRFENQMAFAFYLVPSEFDEEENPYYGEIHEMLIGSSAIISSEDQKENKIKEVICIQESIEQFAELLDETLSDQEYKYVSKKRLERKELSWLLKRHKKLIKLRDKLALKVTSSKKKKEKDARKSEESEPEIMSCFACCATIGGMSTQAVVLRNVPCPNECSGSNEYVCADCLPQLKNQCPYCQQKFEVEDVTD